MEERIRDLQHFLHPSERRVLWFTSARLAAGLYRLQSDIDQIEARAMVEFSTYAI